jgi:hypothetical protein
MRTSTSPPRLARRRPHASVAALALVGAGAVLFAAPARAGVAEPSERADQAFDFMNLLAHHGLHDLDDEDWNAYGQLTNIWSVKLALPAAYTNVGGSTNSLSTDAEFSYTETATFFFGLRLWKGAEAYFVPELIAERPLSGLVGLGGTIQNFELQKSGAPTPTPYLSRAYVRQTFDLGGDRTSVESNPMQIARIDDSRRIVLTLGNFSVLDFFDKNTFSGDLRRSFFNMAFLTYAAYDFAADARGYTWGGMAEFYWDDWALRIGRFAPPKAPNQLPIDFHITQVYGDQIEVEHDHKVLGHAGAVRLLGYRNVEHMGAFGDAISAFRATMTDPQPKSAKNCPDNVFHYNSTNPTAPDMCWVRRSNVKLGIGLNLEQEITPDVGVFFRGMYSDGRTEVYSFTSTDRSISVGAVGRGTVWHRGGDTVGVGWGQGWISSSHAQYLGMGGIDGFIGDGRIRQASEQVLEAFYSASLGSSAWFSLDYQRIWNPAYNADRGPVDIFGARAHVEF